MAKFIKHIGCPKCGSSDANAIYSDGSSYCFSCGKPKGATITPYLLEEEEEKKVILPNDCTQEYHPDAVKWITKYIPLELAFKNNLQYSAYRHQVIFPFYGDSKDLLAYQARNLKPVKPGKRYFTQGDVNGILPIFYGNTSSMDNVLDIRGFHRWTGRLLFLVEDCLSAIKISALGTDAMPLLGSGITRHKLTRLRPFYDVLAVFLDPDMFHKALGLSKTAQLLGFKTYVVQADKDPKELSNEQLLEILNDI